MTQLFPRVNRIRPTEVHHWSPIVHSVSLIGVTKEGRILSYLVPASGTIYDIMLWMDAERPVKTTLTLSRINARQVLDLILRVGPQVLNETLFVQKGDRLTLDLQVYTEGELAPFRGIDLCFKLQTQGEPTLKVEVEDASKSVEESKRLLQGGDT